jgi:predicted  nucleic acid-binding Zn-ribbon protein
MKQCPECYEIYDNVEKFCEADGQRLLSDTTISGICAHRDEVRKGELWFIGIGGVIAGILICIGVYGAYGAWAADTGSTKPPTPVYASQAREAIQTLRPAPSRPEASPAAVETQTVAAEPEASPELPTAPVQESKAMARLNQGPVSTGQRQKDGDEVRTVIQFKDGTTVEVDAAWEDKQGVWYRRGGLVSFVESERVLAITAHAQPKLSPEANH